MSKPTIVSFVVSARDLPSKQRGPQGSTFPDPYVKVYIKNGPTTLEWTDVGKTAKVNNSANVDWLTVFSVDWFQGLRQVLKFDVVDYDTLNKDDVIGTVDVDLDQFVVEKNKEVTVKLSNGGTLLLKGVATVNLHLAVKKLPNLDGVFCGIDAFAECYWSYGVDGERHLFHKTRVQKNVHEAEWDETVVFPSYQQRTDQHFTFRVLDKDPVKNDVVGEVTIEADAFVLRKQHQELRLSKDEANRATITISLA